jgi:hypothetical protein
MIVWFGRVQPSFRSFADPGWLSCCTICATCCWLRLIWAFGGELQLIPGDTAGKDLLVTTIGIFLRKNRLAGESPL